MLVFKFIYHGRRSLKIAREMAILTSHVEVGMTKEFP